MFCCASHPWFRKSKVRTVNLFESYCTPSFLQGVGEGGQALRVKVFNLRSQTALEAYSAEVGAYEKLRSLQGEAISVLYVHGELEHCGCPVIATELVGERFDCSLS